jgi:hypothetical protein
MPSKINYLTIASFLCVLISESLLISSVFTPWWELKNGTLIHINYHESEVKNQHYMSSIIACIVITICLLVFHLLLSVGYLYDLCRQGSPPGELRTMLNTSFWKMGRYILLSIIEIFWIMLVILIYDFGSKHIFDQTYNIWTGYQLAILSLFLLFCNLSIGTIIIMVPVYRSGYLPI